MAIAKRPESQMEKRERLEAYLQKHPTTRLMDLERYTDPVMGPIYVFAIGEVKRGALIEHPRTKVLEYPGGPVQVKKEKAPKAELVKVKIITDLPPIAGSGIDRAMKNGEIVTLPANITKILIGRGAAVMVEETSTETPKTAAPDPPKAPAEPPKEVKVPAPSPEPKDAPEPDPAAPPAKVKATIIHERLHDPKFRFVKVAAPGDKIRGQEASGKEAFEKDWTKTANYRYDDPKLTSHLARGKNYGVVGGFGHLVLIDADEPEIKESVERSLPRTFTVKSGRDGTGGYHFYYYCDEPLDTTPLNRQDDTRKNVGHIKAKGGYVVGPGSIHTTGRAYTIVDDCEVATVEAWQLRAAFSDYLPPPRPDAGDNNKSMVQNEYRNAELDALKVTDFINVKEFRPHGEWTRGANPWHGSTHKGGDFDVKLDGSLFHCFRCDSTGNGLAAFAINEGLAKCEDFRKGGPKLRGENFNRVLERAADKRVLKAAPERGFRPKKGKSGGENKKISHSQSMIRAAEPIVWDGENGFVIIGTPSPGDTTVEIETLSTYCEVNPVLGKHLTVRLNEIDFPHFGYPYEWDVANLGKGLIDRIVSVIHSYVDLHDDRMEAALATWIACTWLKEHWKVCPHVLVYGETTLGKTRVLEIIQKLSYRGMVNDEPTPSVIFHLAEWERPTLTTNEAQDLPEELFDALMRMWRHAFDGSTIRRMSDDRTHVENFHIKTFMAVSSRDRSFVTDVENRAAFTIIMKPKSRPLEDNDYLDIIEDELRDIRGALFSLRLKFLTGSLDINNFKSKAKDVLAKPVKVDGEDVIIADRQKDKAQVLLTVSEMFGVTEEVAGILSEVQVKNNEALRSSFAATVFYAIQKDFLTYYQQDKKTDKFIRISKDEKWYINTTVYDQVVYDLKQRGDYDEKKPLKKGTVTRTIRLLGFDVARGTGGKKYITDKKFVETYEGHLERYGQRPEDEDVVEPAPKNKGLDGFRVEEE